MTARKTDDRPFAGEELVVYRGDVPPGSVTIPNLEPDNEDGPSHYTLSSVNGQMAVPESLVEQFESLPMIERGLETKTITKDDPREAKKKAAKPSAPAPSADSSSDQAKATAGKPATGNNGGKGK